MYNINHKRNNVLGRSFQYARYDLQRAIMFQLAKEAGRDTCFRCGKKIEELKQFTIDHKENWLNSENPKELFYSLENIAFSHSKCNSSAPKGARVKCPSHAAYNRGCRCEGCICAERDYQKEYHKTVRKTNKSI